MLQLQEEGRAIVEAVRGVDIDGAPSTDYLRVRAGRRRRAVSAISPVRWDSGQRRADNEVLDVRNILKQSESLFPPRSRFMNFLSPSGALKLVVMVAASLGGGGRGGRSS